MGSGVPAPKSKTGTPSLPLYTSRLCVKFYLENGLHCFVLRHKLKGRPSGCQHLFKDENAERRPHQFSPGKGRRSCEGTDFAYVPDDEQDTPSSRCSINTRWLAGYMRDHVPQETQDTTFPQVLEKQILSFVFGGCRGTSPKGRESTVVPSGPPCKLQGTLGSRAHKQLTESFGENQET